MSGLEVSIVLPVFNELGHIRDEIARIRRAMDGSGHSYEIVVVDDGSTDGSVERLREIDGIRLIALPENRGPGEARKLGTQAALGEVVVWTDVDMSYPNDEIPALVKELEGFDQVVGARTKEAGTHRPLRVVAKAIIRRLGEYLAQTEIPDLNSGFRAFRRDVAMQFLHLFPSGFSHVTTITMAFLSNGYTVKYVPIEYHTRSGRSKFHWYADTKRYGQQVLRLILMWSPMRVLGPVALTVLLVGAGKLLFDVFDKNFRLGTNTLLIFGAGFAVLLIGVLADLVVQVTKPSSQVLPAVVVASRGDGAVRRDGHDVEAHPPGR